MASLTRYALWVAPEEAASQQLQSVIGQLAAAYSGPVFSPHLTLLSWVRGEEQELASKTESLASSMAPLTTKITGFAGAPYYFRCFFAPLESSSKLRQAVSNATQHFNASAGSGYLAHVSLLYGQMDRKMKKTIPGQVGQKVPLRFSFDKIQLVRMSVSVSAWTTVAEFPLTGS